MLEDRERTKRLFERLGEGGDITTPLGMQPWGADDGKSTDCFGAQWMPNCAA